MPRPDMADHLVHFMSGSTWDAAFGTLCQIINERRLLGSGRINRGGYRCVCFSEAPLPMVRGGLVNSDAYSRYTPFGILVDKSLLFSRGGRPVIYQPEHEYEQLPEEMRWRHMRYEIDVEPRVDFTWEREWRLHADELPLDPSYVALVLPNESWEQRLRSAFDEHRDWQVAEYEQILDRTIAEAYRESFPWRVTYLGMPNLVGQ